MAKPVKHHGKWRARWIDENGKRQSEVFDDFKTAAYEQNYLLFREEDSEEPLHKLFKEDLFSGTFEINVKKVKVAKKEG
jgi:hypothetical protein